MLPTMKVQIFFSYLLEREKLFLICPFLSSFVLKEIVLNIKTKNNEKNVILNIKNKQIINKNLDKKLKLMWDPITVKTTKDNKRVYLILEFDSSSEKCLPLLEHTKSNQLRKRLCTPFLLSKTSII